MIVFFSFLYYLYVQDTPSMCQTSLRKLGRILCLEELRSIIPLAGVFLLHKVVWAALRNESADLHYHSRSRRGQCAVLG